MDRIDPRIIELYDEYTHAPLERRVFLQRLAALTGGMAMALSLVGRLEAGEAPPARLAPDDARLLTERTTFPGATGPIAAYLARPQTAGKQPARKYPAVIVIHENRGLNPHIEDVTRRLAVEGFLALAPDLLSPLGGTPADADSARASIGRLEPENTIGDLLAAVEFLAHHERANGKVGAVGFCWGGGMVGDLAVQSPELDAGVVYYGRQPKAEDVPRIKAPLLLHYAGLDTRINAGIPAFEAALKQARKRYTLHVYPNVNHAFNNDTSEARYDAAAAALAWGCTLEFLRRQLGG